MGCEDENGPKERAFFFPLCFYILTIDLYYILSSNLRFEGFRWATTKTGPNDARYVIWALGKFYYYYFLFLIY